MATNTILRLASKNQIKSKIKKGQNGTFLAIKHDAIDRQM